MPHNDRNEGFRRYELERGGRMRSGTDRDRYRTGYEQRYSPSWDERPGRGGFEGDRSYAAGGYSEEFGARRRGSRDLEGGERSGASGPYGAGDYRADYGSDYRSSKYRQTSEPRERWEHRYADQDDEREAYYRRRDYGEHDFPRRSERDVRLMRWDSLDEPTDDYFGTGPYYGAYATQPGARASGSAYGERGLFGTGENRTWDDIEREETYGPSSGDYEMYGRSSYGAQSGYGRDYGRGFGMQRGYGQDYRERLAEERYGREPEYGYGFGQSPYKSEQVQFRGRGPKGYERSDERLREIICERLTDEPSIDASDVSIDVNDKVVKLTGYVSDRRTKYEIEDLVERSGGVKDIDNQIRVRSGAGITQSSGSHIPTLEQSTAEGTISGADTRTDSRSGSSTQRRT